ncbi:hypothetical protein DSO57_1000310 [Entomophthora muscae]|uniref:Uncharacterized protein n=1 Tax=Entomophthora muscae TaxID=34485 RepID=A0ACC2TKY0_9FUNG|nr:hypothetical protein DSO57_1000310 [Entomophthora muscae]
MRKPLHLIPLLEEQVFAPHQPPEALARALLHAPWLLSGLVLMELDAYFPQSLSRSQLVVGLGWSDGGRPTVMEESAHHRMGSNFTM